MRSKEKIQNYSWSERKMANKTLRMTRLYSISVVPSNEPAVKLQVSQSERAIQKRCKDMPTWPTGNNRATALIGTTEIIQLKKFKALAIQNDIVEFKNTPQVFPQFTHKRLYCVFTSNCMYLVAAAWCKKTRQK